MDTILNTSKLPVWHHESARSCPICGSVMAEASQLVEEGYLYIWYECSTPDCDGQWLTRESASAG